MTAKSPFNWESNGIASVMATLSIGSFKFLSECECYVAVAHFRFARDSQINNDFPRSVALIHDFRRCSRRVKSSGSVQ